MLLVLTVSAFLTPPIEAWQADPFDMNGASLCDMLYGFGDSAWTSREEDTLRYILASGMDLVTSTISAKQTFRHLRRSLDPSRYRLYFEQTAL